MKKLLPQANNLNTLVDVFIYTTNISNWTLNDVAEYCHFDVRQSSYYINACFYLGLLNEDSSLSDLGKSIISERGLIKEKIYEIIISDAIISKIFSYRLIRGDVGIKNYVISFLSQKYPDYSKAVIERRANTIINWCNEIISYVMEKKS